MPKYNTNIFEIPPNSENFTIKKDSGAFPYPHSDYYVFNVGRQKVLVEAWYGNRYKWLGIIDSKVINPGEEYKINASDKPYLITGLKVSNSSDLRALVHCSTVNGYNLVYKEDNMTKLDIRNTVRPLVRFGLRRVAAIGDTLPDIINFFWPKREESIWDNIGKLILHFFDESIQKEIQKILSQDIPVFCQDLRQLASVINSYKPLRNSDLYYINIVEKLINFEKKFYVSQMENSDYININFYLLPLYSASVNFKINIYKFGMKYSKHMGFSEEELDLLTFHAQQLVDSSITHINGVFENKTALEYQTCDPGSMYDVFAAVHMYCAINGTEFFSYWKAILNNPRNVTFSNDVVTYSTSFGRPTPYQARQLLANDIQPPLKPKQGNKIKSIYVGIWRQNQAKSTSKIGGMIIYYENADSKIVGTVNKECKYIDFKNAYLKKLIAWGNGGIDGLEFYFTDGRIELVGTNDSAALKREFELLDHVIVGLYISCDLPGFLGQAVNISVSFQIPPKQVVVNPVATALDSSVLELRRRGKF